MKALRSISLLISLSSILGWCSNDEGFTSDFGVEPLEDFRDFLTGLGSFESGSDSSSSSPASMIAGDADGSRSSSSSSSAAPP